MKTLSSLSLSAGKLAPFLVFALGSVGQACPVCFSAPDSPETKGMTLAILFLLGTIGTVVCGIGSFFMYLVAKQKNPSPGHQELAHLAFAEEAANAR